MRIFKGILFFLLGGIGYVALEFLWRGYSHGSMFLAGGTCFLLLGKLDSICLQRALPLRGLLGAGIITVVELVVGLLFNRDYQVWDYRHLPVTDQGQICLQFFLLWIPISIGAMGLYRFLNKNR